MRREDRTQLYVLVMQSIGAAQPDQDAIKRKLQDIADDQGIEFTWQKRELELNYLANEFLTVRETIAQYDKPPPQQSDLARSAPSDTARSTFSFTPIFRDSSARSFSEIRDRLRNLSFSDGQENGQVDMRILDSLLSQIIADPFTDPLSFITDRRMGVLDDEAMEKLYERGTEA